MRLGQVQDLILKLKLQMNKYLQCDLNFYCMEPKDTAMDHGKYKIFKVISSSS